MRKLLAAALCLAATATGCGASVEPANEAKDAKSTAVTLTNCGHEVTYDKVPERVVTNDVGITELMFALGLED
ncbi:MAG: iron transporter, partial [Streptomyces sp.]|nr:iron transporter [Streptomyces sp.]NUS77823.1 iron transporter [Streptomyces sp.]